jgi:predicted amino acid racemase
MYPRIVIDRHKLIKNTNTIIKMAKENNIDNVTVVVKAFAGDIEVVKTFKEANVTCIGDSRIQNLKKYQNLGFKHLMLLRIPALSEISDVIKYTDISLNSEIEVLKSLNVEAKNQNKKHAVIIMFDLGDLREGLYYKSDYLTFMKQALELNNIIIKGIGTNLTCYGGLVPSNEVLSRLVKIKQNIEMEFDIKLDIVSGGNSSSVTLFNQNQIPEEINHLRLGESILFGKETSYSTEIVGLHHDIYTFEAEVIEIKEKPSYPDGIISINSFGVKPEIEDKGVMKRAILAIGKQDTILDNIKPINKDLTVIGGSSDHLIVDATKSNIKVGDIVEFNINYPALVHLMNSSYVYKVYK